MAAGSDPLDPVWVIGPGRVGRALGLALHRAGMVGKLTYIGRDGAAVGPPPELVVITVPDSEIAAVARDLAARDLSPETVVLHTSGALGIEPLAALATRGVAVGSLHPLVAVPDPETGAERLRGAWFAVEGDARAVVAAERVVAGLGGRILRLDSGGKPLYHAAAVFASNYLVALMAVAVRLLGDAGADGGAAREAVAALAAGAVAGGLTGPISRGDAQTVELHLSRLSARDSLLYSTLARETLALARLQGLDAGLAARIETVLNRKP